VDAKLEQALQSADPNIRKKAIAAIGKSLDYDALPVLANVYKNDADAEVREMARKAGVYIRKNATPDDPFDDGDDNVVDPRQVTVSTVAQQRAQAFVEQGMNFSVSGRNDKARQVLQKAFTLNPALMMDDYVRSLAGQVTGLPPDAAVQALGPGAEKVEVERSSSATTGIIFIVAMLVGGIMLLAGFFLPWLSDEGGDYSGYEIFTNVDQTAVMLSQVENIAQFLESGTFNAFPTSRNITSFSPVLVALAGAVQILAALMIIVGTARNWFWVQGLGFTFAAGAGLGWMYIVTDDLVGIAGFFFDDSFGAQVEAAVGSAFDLLGIGYYLSLAGLAALAFGALGGLILVGDGDDTL